MTTMATTQAVPPDLPVSSLALSRVGTAARLTLRNAYTSLLNRIPDRCLLPIRTAYLQAPDGGARQWLYHSLLQCIRYKHPDPAMESFALADEPSMRFANVNSIVARHLYWFGCRGWEGPEVLAWQYFCSRATRILEIGANIGMYSVCGARQAPHAEYTAVEPHPQTARLLKRNLALNGLDHVRLLEAAIVGHKTTDSMPLVVPLADEDEAPPGSFLQSGGELNIAGRVRYDVRVTAIQDLLPGVDLLKLDVEGYEYEILNPVREYLARERPTIFVEVLLRAKKLQGLIADLARSGAYRIYAVNHAMEAVDPDDVARGRLGGTYHTRDVLLYRADQPLPVQDVLKGARYTSAERLGGSRIRT